MKKLLTALMFITLIFVKLEAQLDLEYHHAMGLGAHAFVPKDDLSEAISGYTFAYQARLNLKNLGDNSSISLVVMPSGGFKLSTREGSNYLYDLPLFASINFGARATKSSDSKFGGYVGAGYQVFGFGATDIGTANGGCPSVMAGVRGNIFNMPLDLSVSYGSHKAGHIFVLRALYALGSGDGSSSSGRSRGRRRR